MTTPSSGVIWTVIAVVSVVTYLLRAVFLLGIDYFEGFPPTLERLLAFFPIAVLSALVVPTLLVVDGGLSIGVDNPRLIAGLVAFGVAWYSDNLLATVGIGMVVFWALLAVS